MFREYSRKAREGANSHLLPMQGGFTPAGFREKRPRGQLLTYLIDLLKILPGLTFGMGK